MPSPTLLCLSAFCLTHKQINRRALSAMTGQYGQAGNTSSAFLAWMQARILGQLSPGRPHLPGHLTHLIPPLMTIILELLKKHCTPKGTRNSDRIEVDRSYCDCKGCVPPKPWKASIEKCSRWPKMHTFRISVIDIVMNLWQCPIEVSINVHKTGCLLAQVMALYVKKTAKLPAGQMR